MMAIGQSALFFPDADLAPSTVYTVTITTAAGDIAGNNLSGNFVFTFTTGTQADTTSPLVVSTNPVNGTTGFSTTGTIEAIFNEPINPSSINPLTFRVNDGSADIAGTISYDSTTNTAGFSPQIALASDKIYTAIVSSGVKDLAGNSMVADYQWSFTAGSSTIPVVTSVTPTDGETGVALNAGVTVVFNTDMNASTINNTSFYLTPNVPATVSYDSATKTATLTPSANLAGGTIYIAILTGTSDYVSEFACAVITTAIQDASGTPFEINGSWAFTTTIATIYNVAYNSKLYFQGSNGKVEKIYELY